MRHRDDVASAGEPGADDPTLESSLLAAGRDVGGYTIDGVLGEGGMGIVYAATHPVIGKRAAIKVLRPELSSDYHAVDRFIGEARAVNAIGHPNIVDIFAFGALPDGRSYYIMDLLVGETLRARLKRGPLHVSEAASVIEETASALLAAHAKNIIHRDLKPDNVFMVTIPGRWPEVKLLDWGLAKLAPSISAMTRTLAGQVLGTPLYMSPEQASGGSVDHRTDIYALGVMAFELLTGAAPFVKRSSLDTMVAHQEDPVPPLIAKVAGVPEELVQLIEAMLAKDAEQRPTLAAVRAVVKRLRGTKIPTITAAGVQLALAPAPTPELTTPGLPSSSPSQVQREPAPASGPRHTPGSNFPSTRPGYSMPDPHGARRPPVTAAPTPSSPLVAPPRSRRWLVITLAAVIVSAIGIAVTLLAG
jgi:serine/threonine-protein kinase